MKLVKWLAGLVVGLVVLVGVAIVALPHLIPMESIVAEGAAKVEEATGRKLVVSGKPELSIWPEAAIRVEGVKFANAPGAPGGDMIEAQAARIAVPVLPLISGAVEVKEFILVEPTVRLYVDKNGVANWTFGKAGDKAGGGSGGASTGGGPAIPEELKSFKLGDVRIQKGTVVYEDARAGTKETLSDIDLALTLPSLEGPLGAKGGLVWKNERIEIDLDMAKPLAVLEKAKSALKASVETKHLIASFDGEATFADAFALAGEAAAKTPSIKALAAWAAEPIPAEGDILGPFSADGAFSLAGAKISFTGAKIALDKLAGKGDFAFDGGGKVPAISAKMKLGALDVNPYMPQGTSGGTGGDAAAESAQPAAGGAPAEIDLSALKLVNADFDLAVDSLTMREFQFGPTRIDGKLAGGKLQANLAIERDGATEKGNLVLDGSGKKPYLAANLALGALDLNRYLPVPEPDAGGGGPAAAAGPGKWSDEPLDLSALNLMNADFDLKLQSLKVQEVKIGASELKGSLKNGVLTMNLARMAAYGGSGTAKVIVDSAGKTPKVTKTFAFKGVEALPLLTDAAGFDELEGKGDIELRLVAVGKSEAEMVKTVDGNGKFIFRDGAVKGFNLGAMVRNVKSAFLDSDADKRQQTDFSELSGTFKIQNGKVTNDDLFMAAPLFRVTGKGEASLPARTVNYRVKPKAVASATGQGGKTDLAGIAIPVIIKGPWHDISYAPDLTGAIENLAKDPAKAVGAVKDVVNDVAKQPEKAVDAIKGLIPGSGGSGGGTPAPVEDAVKGLKGLFGK